MSQTTEQGDPNPDQAGQLNAYFRWKNKSDEPARFEMELSLADAKEIPTGTQRFAVPEKSLTDVTPRRLQEFKVQADKSYAWRLLEAGSPVQTSDVRADSIGLLTIPRLTITAVPRTLILEPKR